MQKELQNISSTAHKLGVPVNWLKEKALAGTIPCLKIRNRLLFNVKAVEEVLLKMAAEGSNND